MSVILAFCAVSTLYCQPGLTLGPYFPADTVGLFDRLDVIEARASAAAPEAYRDFYVESYEDRSVLLKRKVRDSLFIFNATVQADLEGVMRELTLANDLPIDPVIFLSRSPAINASSYADGIFVINVGLIDGLAGRGALAYVLAHELAHDQLRHQWLRLQRLAELAGEQPATRRERRMYRRRVRREGRGEVLSELRGHLYEQHRHSRAAELQADSLALNYLRRAGLPTGAALQALDRLEKGNHLAVDRETLPRELSTPTYPFKPSWVAPEATMFGGSFGGEAEGGNDDDFWQADSLATHPELDERRVVLRTMVDTVTTEGRAGDEPLHREWAYRELINSYLGADLVAHALILTLRGLETQPDSDHYAAVVVQALLRTHRSIVERNFDRAIPPSRFFDDEGSRAVVRMLHRMRASELRRLTVAYANEKLAEHPDSEALRTAERRVRAYFSD